LFTNFLFYYLHGICLVISDRTDARTDPTTKQKAYKEAEPETNTGPNRWCVMDLKSYFCNLVHWHKSATNYPVLFCFLFNRADIGADARANKQTDKVSSDSEA
jgi:hypothetical protein